MISVSMTILVPTTFGMPVSIFHYGNSTDPSARSVYFLRVRSASLNPDDAGGGITGGSTVHCVNRRASFPWELGAIWDIRYANQGIHVQGLMSNSPLLEKFKRTKWQCKLNSHLISSPVVSRRTITPWWVVPLVAELSTSGT